MMKGEIEGKWTRGLLVEGESGLVVALFLGTWWMTLGPEDIISLAFPKFEHRNQLPS